MNRSALVICVALSTLVGGCVSTKVETSGVASSTTLCQSPGQGLSAIVLWGPIWRPNQKDVPLREEAARQGLEAFLASSGCFAKFHVKRLPGGGSAVVPADQELLSLASTMNPRPDRVVVITVRELGPIVKLFNSLALVEGGTEVVLGLIVIDANTGASLAHIQTHWQNGGALVIKGVSSLPQDMNAALRAALLSSDQHHEGG